MNFMKFRGVTDMAVDEAFLRTIPKFLRRPQEPVPEEPIFMAPRGPATPPPASIPTAIQASAEAPVRRPGSLATPRPAPVRAEVRGSKVERPVVGGPEVVSLPSRRAAPTAIRPALPSGDFFANTRGDIENLFATDVQDIPAQEDDAAFQVTLPRSVIRQIRILAAQEGTTQRAIVLKALRLAGLTVPKGADIDRRILAGKRRQQA